MVARGRVVATVAAVLFMLAAGCTGSGAPRASSSSPPAHSTTEAVASASASTTTTAPQTTTTAPAGTEIAYAAPVDMAGRRVASINIATSATGTCEPGSDAIGDAEVYRCFADSYVYDPCWADADGGVLCMAAPWLRDVDHLDVNEVDPGVDVQTTNLDFPWAVELTSGEKCLAAQGAHDDFRGTVIDYGCTGPSQLALLRGLNRSAPYWTFQSVAGDGSSVDTVTVATAWFAGPAPPTAAPPCRGEDLSVSARDSTYQGIVAGAYLIIQNTTANTCSLHGYPGVAALDSSDEQVGQAQRLPYSYGPPPTIYLGPRASAAASVQGNRSGTGSCPTFPALLVTPPNTTTSTQVAVDQLELCDDFGVSITGFGDVPSPSA